MAEDYDIATENMRVNLHERAKQQGLVVKTRRGDGEWEGLRFRFSPRAATEVLVARGRSPTRMNQMHYPTGDPRRLLWQTPREAMLRGPHLPRNACSRWMPEEGLEPPTRGL